MGVAYKIVLDASLFVIDLTCGDMRIPPRKFSPSPGDGRIRRQMR